MAGMGKGKTASERGQECDPMNVVGYLLGLDEKFSF